MDLLSVYGDDGDSRDQEEEEEIDELAPSKVKQAIAKVAAAPDVDTSGMVVHDSQATHSAAVRLLPDPTARKVMYNLPIEDLHAPVLGPAHPYSKDGMSAGLRNHRAGHVEDAYMHPHHFEEQYNTFQARGYAHAPGGQGVVGDAQSYTNHEGETVWTGGGGKRKKTAAERQEEKDAKAARLAQQGEIDPEIPFTITSKQPWANKEVEVAELTEEQKAHIAAKEAAKVEAATGDVEKKGPSSFFHGKEDKDYQGRSWLAPPRDRKNESGTTFLPKRWIHTWSGHTKGVNAIRFFPNTGHLLLSAGLDGKIKIWDVNNGGKCMRSYLGHSKGVRDITFTKDGKKFMSTGYDKQMRLWDTETGKVIQTISNGKVFYCVTLHPENQSTLMAGANDKKIYQWDLDTGNLVQEYNYHLGAVNTVTFLDPPSGSRFVTTSDDKTIRMWEFGIPVQIKYLADPSMHAISAATLNPQNTMWLGQSQDNQIVSYSCAKGEKFRMQKNKVFKGHNTAGYACAVGFSPDAKYVMSGDSEGRCFFWEWSHPNKVVRTIKAHEGVCIAAAWNPMESSKVATCGWDGLIKYWD